MDYDLLAILSLSIIIPAIIGIIRFKKINKVYYPFIYCIWIGTVNETIGIILAYAHHGSLVYVNIYMLIEYLLLMRQFKKWKLFERNNNGYILILIILVLEWIWENFIKANISIYNSYFTILYSSVLSFMSIIMINRQIVIERRSLLKNPIFIICVAFVMFYMYSVLSEIFWLYGLSESKSFQEAVYYITVITNFISLIFYSIAILWMPSKQRFTLPSS